MNIYVIHSKYFDYKNELYVPIRNSVLNNKHIFVFPHETVAFTNSKEIIKNADLIIAEVSYQSTGSGIELGWAEVIGKKVICLYKKDAKISGSLKVVSDTFIEYVNSEDLIIKLTDIISKHARS